MPRLEIRVSGGDYVLPPPRGTGLEWRLPADGSPHPNAPDRKEHDQGGPERWNWVTPDRTVVLNAKANAGIHCIRLEGPGGPKRQADLRSFIRSEDGVELTETELFIDADGSIAARNRDRPLGTIPDSARPRLRSYLEDAQTRGWRTITWAHVVPGNLSATMGHHPPKTTLVAEVSIPADDEPLFADSYDASFCFPYKRVRAYRDTPEGKAVYEKFLASFPAPREYFPIRIGELELRATWNEHDGNDHVRGIEIMDPENSIWIRGGMPDALLERGILITYVAGFEHHDGQTSAAFAAEQPLVLVPEPKNKYDPNAIAVWSADRRTMAGYVPRDDAAWATNWMNRTRQPLYAIVTTEFIDRQTHQRTGLRMLLAPQPIVIAKP